MREAGLRHLNPGRLGNKYDVFFTHMEAWIGESLVAADDGRHGASNMSQWVSIKDLIKKTSARCPENTPVPSKNLVRLQFIPKNPLKFYYPSSGKTQNTTNTTTCCTS